MSARLCPSLVAAAPDKGNWRRIGSPLASRGTGARLPIHPLAALRDSPLVNPQTRKRVQRIADAGTGGHVLVDTLPKVIQGNAVASQLFEPELIVGDISAL